MKKDLFYATRTASVIAVLCAMAACKDDNKPEPIVVEPNPYEFQYDSAIGSCNEMECIISHLFLQDSINHVFVNNSGCVRHNNTRPNAFALHADSKETVMDIFCNWLPSDATDQRLIKMPEEDTYVFTAYDTLGTRQGAVVLKMIDKPDSLAVAYFQEYSTSYLAEVLFVQDDKWSYAIDFKGFGTRTQPFIIENESDLALLSEKVNGHQNINGIKSYEAYYIQTADIDCHEYRHEPIGKDAYYYFGGNYDGGGHTITLPELKGSGQHFGLFGYTRFADLHDIILDGSVDLHLNRELYCGSLIGQMDSLCKVSRVVNRAKINCFSDYNAIYVGGIVGRKTGNATFFQCLNLGDLLVSGNGVCAGGIVGHATSASVVALYNQCGNKGLITTWSSDDNYAGGLIGKNFDDKQTDEITQIVNSYNSGAITTELSNSNFSSAAGLIGHHLSNGIKGRYPSIINSYSNAIITIKAEKGNSVTYGAGIVGFCFDDQTHIQNAYTNGEISVVGLGNAYTVNAITSKNGIIDHCFWAQGFPLVNATATGTGQVTNCNHFYNAYTGRLFQSDRTLSQELSVWVKDRQKAQIWSYSEDDKHRITAITDSVDLCLWDNEAMPHLIFQSTEEGNLDINLLNDNTSK